MKLAVLRLPDQGQLVLAKGLQVPVDCVVDDIDLPAHEPLIERLAGIIQNLVPLLEPVEFGGLGGPESLRILPGFL